MSMKFDADHEVVRGKDIVPARPLALQLADALNDLNLARTALETAIEKVPHYTGQWDSLDYYAEEQDDFNRAAEHFEDVVAVVANQFRLGKD